MHGAVQAIVAPVEPHSNGQASATTLRDSDRPSVHESLDPPWRDITCMVPSCVESRWIGLHLGRDFAGSARSNEFSQVATCEDNDIGKNAGLVNLIKLLADNVALVVVDIVDKISLLRN
jgi:hypothetical protein